MDIVLDSLAGRLGRSLEERTHIHVKTAVGVTGGYNLGTAVVTVLTHLGNHDTGLTALLLSELCCKLAGSLKVCVFLAF